MRLVLPALLLLACACTGGSRWAPAPATGLAYQNPGGAGWRLARNPAKSTPTHLVLDLLAPPGTVGLGAGFNMTADASRITWAKVESGDPYPVHNEALDLGPEPQLLLGLAQGNSLRVGGFQKDLASPVAYSGAILQVAVDFLPVAGLLAGEPVPMAVTTGLHLEADGTRSPITVAVGTLAGR